MGNYTLEVVMDPFPIRNKNPLETFHQMQSFLEAREPDCALYSNCGYKFQIHKEVLCQTNFLRALLSGNECYCGRDIEIFLPSFGREELRCIVEFLYTGDVRLSSEISAMEFVQNLIQVFGFPESLSFEAGVYSVQDCAFCQRPISIEKFEEHFFEEIATFIRNAEEDMRLHKNITCHLCHKSINYIGADDHEAAVKSHFEEFHRYLYNHDEVPDNLNASMSDAEPTQEIQAYSMPAEEFENSERPKSPLFSSDEEEDEENEEDIVTNPGVSDLDPEFEPEDPDLAVPGPSTSNGVELGRLTPLKISTRDLNTEKVAKKKKKKKRKTESEGTENGGATKKAKTAKRVRYRCLYCMGTTDKAHFLRHIAVHAKSEKFEPLKTAEGYKCHQCDHEHKQLHFSREHIILQHYKQDLLESFGVNEFSELYEEVVEDKDQA